MPAHQTGQLHSTGAGAVLGLGVITLYIGALAWSVQNVSFDIYGAVLIAPILFFLTVPLARRAARIETDPRMIRIVLGALALKLVASVVRYAMVFDLYGGGGDARRYAAAGRVIAESLRLGIWDTTAARGNVGTGFIDILTGIVFTFTGPTTLGGFLVFSWLGFWGLYFFYRAFRVGVPDGDRRRFALLVFFLPSLLFWPSSIGKESWMLLTLGLSAFGVAKVLTRKRGAYLTLGLGLLGAAMVRPHMSALICAGMALAYLLRRNSGKVSSFGPVTRIVGGLVIITVSALVLQQVESFFGLEDEGLGGAEQVLDQSAEQTDTGGSNYEATNARHPKHLPMAVVSVLFRPFPFEAHNMQSLFTSLEGTLLLGLFVLGWRRLRQSVKSAWQHPYVAFAAVYSLLFIVAFSSFGNFGILARQRVQLFPLVLVFLALPFTVARRPATWRARN